MTRPFPPGAAQPWAPPAGHPEPRSALGRFASGVALLTAGRLIPHAVTVNSLTAVPTEPPLVVVSVPRAASVHATVERDREFAVSVLSGRQHAVAARFAERHRPRGRQEFAGVDTFRGRRTGAPLLNGALAWLECALTDVRDGGDHSVFLGSVLHLTAGPPGDPLVHFAGAFRTLGRAPGPGGPR
ncbi:flavin reductase family protein [Streptomyces sp. NPDC052077]|uniref:flavin reductase family protein n=1 Tax=Streptomyces sp. NPDC052077 TaxID=3154757 RepID=UPI00343B978F